MRAYITPTTLVSAFLVQIYKWVNDCILDDRIILYNDYIYLFIDKIMVTLL